MPRLAAGSRVEHSRLSWAAVACLLKCLALVNAVQEDVAGQAHHPEMAFVSILYFEMSPEIISVCCY